MRASQMTTDAFCALLLLLTGALALASAVAAQNAPTPAPQLHIAAPDTLLDGSHVNIEVTVEFAAANDQPLLLSPSSQGAAVEVVRGRLSRSDARASTGNQVRFDVPVVAHGQGTAILHVELSAYVCSTRCKRVVSTADQVIRVARRTP